GGSYDFAILNPPYVRQEWIDNKSLYRRIFHERYGVNIPGTSNLYIYFVIKSLAELRPGGKLVCIIYDSWLYTKYGQWMKGMLRANCDSYESVDVGPQPFQGRLIDATILTARRSRKAFSSEPIHDDSDRISVMTGVDGFSKMEDLCRTERGLRLKQANFFLTGVDDVQRLGATAFVKKPATIPAYRVPQEHHEAALLLYDTLSMNKEVMKELKRRLSRAKQDPDKNVAILTWYQERPECWYIHRKPSHAPLIFNYYLRNRPRHIFNPHRAFSDNFYGLTFSPHISPLMVLAVMNSTGVCAEILDRSRRQGNGLRKIQLYEYREVLVPDWQRISKQAKKKLERFGKQLVSSPSTSEQVVRNIDELIFSEYATDKLNPTRLRDVCCTSALARGTKQCVG
ncbi:Eco57I restriction-modification methylase domain-containing protein, partial [Verrucomicrobiota bacterium]